MTALQNENAKPFEAYKKILVIKLGALGDFVQACGAFRRLRDVHKNAHITLLTRKPYASLGRDCGYFDDVVIDENPKLYQLGKMLRLRTFFRDSGFERVYDMQNNDRTSLYFRFSGLKNQCEWVGVAQGASHQDVSKDRSQIHVFDMLKQTMKIGGVDGISIDNLEWMDGDVSGFALKEPYVLFVPGCAPTRLEKRWPAGHYIDLATRLGARGYQIVLLGTEAEADVTHKIESACENVLNLTGQTSLQQIVALGRGAAGAVSNDTGPAHFLGPSGCALLILYPKCSNPSRFCALGAHVRTIQKDRIADIGVDDVEATFTALLDA